MHVFREIVGVALPYLALAVFVLGLAWRALGYGWRAALLLASVVGALLGFKNLLT